MKCVRTDEGLRFWNGNKLIAFTDESDELFVLDPSTGQPLGRGKAYNEREAREILAQNGIS